MPILPIRPVLAVVIAVAALNALSACSPNLGLADSQTSDRLTVTEAFNASGVIAPSRPYTRSIFTPNDF